MFFIDHCIWYLVWERIHSGDIDRYIDTALQEIIVGVTPPGIGVCEDIRGFIVLS